MRHAHFGVFWRFVHLEMRHLTSCSSGRHPVNWRWPLRSRASSHPERASLIFTLALLVKLCSARYTSESGMFAIEQCPYPEEVTPRSNVNPNNLETSRREVERLVEEHLESLKKQAFFLSPARYGRSSSRLSTTTVRSRTSTIARIWHRLGRCQVPDG